VKVGAGISQKYCNLTCLAKEKRKNLIEPDWLIILVDRGENKVTSFKLAKYNFAAAYLDTSVLLLLLTGTHT
jgi:hypothetical protein